ncbi:MAG: retropepsin-like aspartic protease family protein [Saezia sp.]
MSLPNNNLIQTIKIAIIWLLVAAAIYFVIVYIERKQTQNQITVTGEAIEIKRSRDGHYYWTGSVNGHPITFLIDTGASITSIPESLVQQAGLPLGASIQLQTANGTRNSNLVKGDLCLEGGICINNLPMTIVYSHDDYGLLGMNVINKMNWSQNNRTMRFEPPRN